MCSDLLQLPNRSPSKLVGLDFLRGWSAVGVVLLHSCVPYALHPMPGLSWSCFDRGSLGVSVVMWAIEIVIMPIFLVIAGFLAAKSMAAAGPGPTMRSRLKRLGRPLLLAMIVVLPIDLYIWLLGWVADGAIPWTKLRSLKFAGQIDQNLWGLSHLWFLQYLLTYVVLLAAGWHSIRLASPRIIGCACGFTAVFTLSSAPEVVWGFQHSFWPVASKWIYSGAFFVGGVALWMIDPELRKVIQPAFRSTLIGIFFLAAAVRLGIWRLEAIDSLPSDLLSLNLVLAALCVAAAAWVTLGMLGLASRADVRLDRVTSRLAESSLLIYLLHHPLVALAHVTLKHAVPSLPIGIKLCVVLSIGVTVPTLVQMLWQGSFAKRRQKERRDGLVLSGEFRDRRAA